MKKIFAFSILALMAATACHKPEYVEPTVKRQGITSISAIIPSGQYADQVLTKLVVDEESFLSGNFVLEVPYYFPETSEDQSVKYMTALRVQAELQPNYRISPALGMLDMTEPHEYTLTSPDGSTRTITISAKRVKPKACSLLSFLVEDVMVSGVIYEEKKEILIPYLDDLSSVSVSGQVSSHATISKISGAKYEEGGKYSMNDGATVTVLAANGTNYQTYTVRKGIPELLEQGLRVSSISNLFNIDPVSMCGLPSYDVESFVSLAGLGSNIVVSTGTGNPVYLNCYTGQKIGELNLGGIAADAITNDEAGHMLICNFAQGGASAETVNIYKMASITDAPALVYSFVNPVTEPIGHRIKVLGNIESNAVIVLTAEGIQGVTTTAKAVVLNVSAGAVTKVYSVDFADLGFGWGSAPVHFATIIPASMTPELDGWFLDYYEGNSDPAAEAAGDESYILHYVDGKHKDNQAALIGNWANNPNCLDIKTFNHSRYMTLFVVSHFPQWGAGPRLYLFDVNDPSSASLVLGNTAIEWYQKGSYASDLGASGDVVIMTTPDGYRMYVYYYDHHAQAIGAYVADCFKI